jgi:ADP-heptose:LPS heptosyltransferase
VVTRDAALSAAAAEAPAGASLAGAAAAALLAAGATLWAGGTSAGARALLVAVVAALLAGEGLARSAGGRRLDSWERAWLWPWLAVSGLVALQLTPLPGVLSARLGAIPEAARAAAGSGGARITPAPLATLSSWAAFTAYWGIAFAVARLRRRELRWLAALLLSLACFEALYGLVAFAQGHESILGIWPRRHYLGDATGTFVNRNHFAGFLALAWPISLSFLVADAEEGGAGGPRALRIAAACVLSLLVGSALVASHSRLGGLAGVAALSAWAALGRARRAQPGAGAGSGRLALGLAALAGAGALWIGPGRLLERWLALPESADRLAVWSALARLPARTWILGAGAGSFADVFKTVQPGSLRASYDYAHSDAIELLLDYGVVGVLAIAAAALAWWRRVAPAALSPLRRGALAGLAAVAVRVCGDFDLHVPGTAVAAWIALGIVARRTGVPDGEVAALPPRRPRTLVVELWGLGDAVLMTSALRPLVASGREVVVLCKASSRAFLTPGFPEVEFWCLDAPWTAFRRKYRLWRWPWRELSRLLLRLRTQRFDEGLSVRADPRDHALLWLAGVRRRCGFPRAGSRRLLNAAVPPAPLRHKVEDWRALLARLPEAPLGCVTPAVRPPDQLPAPAARVAAGGLPRVVLHCGAGQPVRRWPLASWAGLLERLRRRYAFHLVLIADADGFGSELAPRADELLRRPSSQELVAALSQAALFLGNDSGPAHLAAALGAATVVVFGPQHPELFRPYDRDGLVVSGSPCPYRPCADRCRLSEPRCLTGISDAEAAREVLRHVDALIARGRLPRSLVRAPSGSSARPADAPAAPGAGG